ncbi:MAG: peptide deformylase [Bacilli bacterium]
MLKVVKDNVASLREKCELVTLPLSKEDEKTLKEMISYLKKSQDEKYCQKHHIRAGVGLAAPQIGINKRMFAIYYTNEDEVIQYGLVNPKIIQNSTKKVALKGGEGCLSVDDDHHGYVYRYDKIVMKAYDIVSGKEVLIKAKGYDAIVLQHEYDHLDGILYYDRINKQEPNKEIPNSYLL